MPARQEIVVGENGELLNRVHAEVLAEDTPWPRIRVVVDDKAVKAYVFWVGRLPSMRAHQISFSTREADTPQKVYKAGIRPERIEARPHKDPRAEPLRIGFFQPGHCLILVA